MLCFWLAHCSYCAGLAAPSMCCAFAGRYNYCCTRSKGKSEGQKVNWKFTPHKLGIWKILFPFSFSSLQPSHTIKHPRHQIQIPCRHHNSQPHSLHSADRFQQPSWYRQPKRLSFICTDFEQRNTPRQRWRPRRGSGIGKADPQSTLERIVPHLIVLRP